MIPTKEQQRAAAKEQRRKKRADNRRKETQRRRVRGLYYPTSVTPDDFFDAMGKLRKEAEIEIDRLMALIDAIDDAAPEADADFEPVLGSAISGYGSENYDQELWGGYFEDDADEREGTDPDLEPSLGWSTTGAHGADDDREDQHDDREPDDDGEPLLGAFEGFINQDAAWVSSGIPHFDHEAEADALDAGEFDEAERSGIGDEDGAFEQCGFVSFGYGSCRHVE